MSTMCQNVLHFVMEVHLSIAILLQLSLYFSETHFSVFLTNLDLWKYCAPDTDLPLQFLALFTSAKMLLLSIVSYTVRFTLSHLKQK